MLNLPDLKALHDCNNVLVAGIGGGYDLFCGLPIYFELRERGQTVHLANLSFSQVRWLKEGVALAEGLVGVTAASRTYLPYFPELHLARWFKEARDEDVPIWCFNAEAARPLRDLYTRLVDQLGIDGILLVDGGVDSLIRGDESDLGTVLEDAVSLSAISELPGQTARTLACIGLGAEQDISHAHIFENIAALTEAGGFHGSCSLVRGTPPYDRYEAAVEFVQAQPGQDSSVINSSILSAVQGHYGNHHDTTRTRGSKLWISPLMPIYWFFDLPAVAERNHFLPLIRHSETRREVMEALAQYRTLVPRRPAARIPLS